MKPSIARSALVRLFSAATIASAFGYVGCGGHESESTADVSDATVEGGDEASVDPDPGADDDGDGLPDDAGTTTPPPFPLDDAGPSIPTKIKYVIVLVKENHTFDNYFTGFPGAESSTKAKLSNGTTVTRPVAPDGDLKSDLCHSNSCGQKAYRGGAMNGFDLTGDGQLPLIRYTEAQIPNYWQYARNFVLADHMFSTTLGPSSPGHEVFWFARSTTLDNAKCNTPDGGGCTGSGCTASKNVTITSYDPDTCTTKTVAPCFNLPVLSDHLPDGFTWSDYGGPMALQSKWVVSQPDYTKHFRKAGDLVPDLASGHLANLTIAHLSGGVASEHPTANPCPGENLTVQIITAAMKLPQWKEMAIVVTWDDWGGFYDHVAPPVHKCSNGEIFQNGFRLPLMIISPYAKKGYVLKTPTEQASVPKLVEELWGIPFMSTRDKHARDGSSGSLMEAFDFTQAPRDPLLLSTRTCP
ncbi:MAG: alkaline phosphatase family protein [Polyangiales bacterium]